MLYNCIFNNMLNLYDEETHRKTPYVLEKMMIEELLLDKLVSVYLSTNYPAKFFETCLEKDRLDIYYFIKECTVKQLATQLKLKNLFENQLRTESFFYFNPRYKIDYGAKLGTNFSNNIIRLVDHHFNSEHCYAPKSRYKDMVKEKTLDELINFYYCEVCNRVCYGNYHEEINKEWFLP